MFSFICRIFDHFWWVFSGPWKSSPTLRNWFSPRQRNHQGNNKDPSRQWVNISWETSQKHFIPIIQEILELQVKKCQEQHFNNFSLFLRCCFVQMCFLLLHFFGCLLLPDVVFVFFFLWIFKSSSVDRIHRLRLFIRCFLRFQPHENQGKHSLLYVNPSFLVFALI